MEGAIKIDKGGQLTSMNISGSVEYTANFNLVSIVYLSILRTHIIFMRSLDIILNTAYTIRAMCHSPHRVKKFVTHNYVVIESRIACR